MPNPLNLTGLRFGRWAVGKRVGTQNGQSTWLCKCDCGTEKVIRSNSLVRNRSNSCGCLKLQFFIENNTSHKLSHHPLYKTWMNMKSRCYNPNTKYYESYGGRGIRICEEWKYDFKAFYDWSMGNGWEGTLSIDRKQVNGNYEPGNCRWVTQMKQQNNRRINRFIEFQGEERTLMEWSREFGIKYATLSARLKYGWDIERALFTPVGDKS